MSPPDFLCIGASKTGTTWLHEQLMSHDDIWVPFVKELHYFDHKEVKRWISSITKPSVFGSVVRSAIIKGIVRGEFSWLNRYLLKERLPEDYHKIFEGRGEKVTGEVTPSYSWLPEETIRQIAEVQPDCKIIYILREPAERTWSQLNMIRQRGGDDLSSEEIYARLKKRHLASSDYLSNLSNWEKHFPIEQIHVGFYDELKANPISFLNKIYQFLRVTEITGSKPDQELRKKVNKGRYRGEASEIPMVLTQKYHQELIEIHKKFDNDYTAKWLSDSERKIGIES